VCLREKKTPDQAKKRGDNPLHEVNMAILCLFFKKYAILRQPHPATIINDLIEGSALNWDDLYGSASEIGTYED